MSEWTWFSKDGRPSADLSLTRRDGLVAHLRVGGGSVDVQIAKSRNVSFGWTCNVNADDPVSGHLGAWPLPTFYLSADSSWLRRLAEALGGDEGREVRAWFGPDKSVDLVSAHWSLWQNPNEWTAGTPRWKHGSVSPLSMIFGETQYETHRVGETEVVEVAMPEGRYRVEITMEERVWRRARWPGDWMRVRSTNIEVLDKGGIPIPGKGENAWDCGEDAVYQCSFPGDSASAALEKFITGIHKTRVRRAGGAWVPTTRTETNDE